MLEGLAPPDRVTSCAVRTIRQRLDEADRVILDKALGELDAWPHKTLAAALTLRGVKISEKPIRMHRSGLCSCR